MQVQFFPREFITGKWFKHMPAFHDGFSVFIPPFFVAM